MAPLPEIDHVYRVAFEWALGVIHPVNVMHFHVPGSEDVAQIAGIIGSAYPATGSKPFAALSSSYQTSSVLITPLDGSTAGTNQPLGKVLQGNASGDEIPNQACVVSFHSTQRGSRGRGRIYVGPTTEENTAGGIVNATLQSQVLAGFNTWFTAMRAATPPVDPCIASYTHADQHTIVGLRVDNVCGTQRRRLDQRR